jgi:hypothetical protein
MTKNEEKLVREIVTLADEQLGGQRSQKARRLFCDIAKACEELGFTRLERIARMVGEHYDYGC